jgi:hypothetical protein
LAQRYPTLTSAQIKQAIVQASGNVNAVLTMPTYEAAAAQAEEILRASNTSGPGTYRGTYT